MSIKRTRKGGLHISKGKKISWRSPSYRIGDKNSGLNISKSGFPFSQKTPLETFNSKKGCATTGVGDIVPILFSLIIITIFVIH